MGANPLLLEVQRRVRMPELTRKEQGQLDPSQKKTYTELQKAFVDAPIQRNWASNAELVSLVGGGILAVSAILLGLRTTGRNAPLDPATIHSLTIAAASCGGASLLFFAAGVGFYHYTPEIKSERELCAFIAKIQQELNTKDNK